MSPLLKFCRISLSHKKYQAIKLPVSFDDNNGTELYLGKSEKGVTLHNMVPMIYFGFGCLMNRVAEWTGCSSITATSCMCYASGAANRLVDPGFYRMSTTASIVMFFQTIISKKHRWKRKMDGTLTVMMFLAMMGIEVKGMRVGFFRSLDPILSKRLYFLANQKRGGLPITGIPSKFKTWETCTQQDTTILQKCTQVYMSLFLTLHAGCEGPEKQLT